MIYKFFDAAKPEEKELNNGFSHLAVKEVRTCFCQPKLNYEFSTLGIKLIGTGTSSYRV
jgi:hypothetical protein